MGVKSFIIALVAMLAAGCGSNMLRLESAGQVSVAATAMVTQAREALDLTLQRRREAGETLVASDPSCMPGENLVVVVPGPNWTPGTPPVPLCGNPPAGYQQQIVSLRAIPDDALRPTLLLIGAVADYGSALSKIVARPTTDIGDELNAIAAKAGEAVVLANALLKAEISNPVTALAGEQAQAAIAMIEFVNQLTAEARRVRDVREFMRRNGGAIDSQIASLRTQLNRWLEVSAQGDSEVIVNNLRRAYDVERRQLGFQQRLAFVQLINNARMQVDSVEARRTAIDRALRTFQASQTQLREYLAGDFSPEDRARIARLNRDRMIEALGLLTQAMVKFGVTL